jgi:hypothetical protein
MTLRAAERDTRLVGVILVERNLLTAAQLDQALRRQTESGKPLGEVVEEEFGIPQTKVSGILAEQLAELEGHSVAPGSPMESPPRMGETLVELGLASREDVDAALEAQRSTGERLGEILVARGVISRIELAGALSEHWSAMTKFRRPGEPVFSSETDPSVADGSELIGALAARLEGLEARLGAEPAEAESPLSEKVEALGGGFESLDRTVHEVEARVVSLVSENQDRADATLKRLEAEVASLADATSAQVEALASQLIASGTVDARLGDLEARLGESMPANESDLASRLDSLDAQVVELATLLGDLESRAGADATESESSAAAALERLEAEVTGVRDELRSKLDEPAAQGIAAAEIANGVAEMERRLGESIAAQEHEFGSRLESLGERVSELAGVLADVDGRASATESGERSAEAAVERVVAEVADLRDQLQSKLDEPAAQGIAAAEIASRLAETEARLGESAAARNGDLSRQVESLGSRVEQLAALLGDVEPGAIAALAQAQRGMEEMVDRVADEIGALTTASHASAETQASSLSVTDALAGRLDDVEKRIEERVTAGQLHELAEVQHQLSGAIDRVSVELGAVRAEMCVKLDTLASVAADAADQGGTVSSEALTELSERLLCLEAGLVEERAVRQALERELEDVKRGIGEAESAAMLVSALGLEEAVTQIGPVAVPGAKQKRLGKKSKKRRRDG